LAAIAIRRIDLSMTLEQPFKDTAERPHPDGWSPHRAQLLGRANLDASTPYSANSSSLHEARAGEHANHLKVDIPKRNIPKWNTPFARRRRATPMTPSQSVRRQSGNLESDVDIDNDPRRPEKNGDEPAPRLLEQQGVPRAEPRFRVGPGYLSSRFGLVIGSNSSVYLVRSLQFQASGVVSHSQRGSVGPWCSPSCRSTPVCLVEHPDAESEDSTPLRRSSCEPCCDS
jgi:hypothetical protein